MRMKKKFESLKFSNSYLSFVFQLQVFLELQDLSMQVGRPSFMAEIDPMLLSRNNKGMKGSIPSFKPN